MSRNSKATITHQFGAAPSLLERAPLVIPTAKFAHEPLHSVNAQGNNVLENLRVFRTGTFTDMFGFQHTWDDTHLDLMVMHFTLLRDSGVFPDVPLRADHGSSVLGVVGYYQDLYRDREDPQFLSATVEFTEPEAWEKWQRRTWRSRSIEIGMYETNDNRSYWPVVMGLAFVDIPAVEGLHGRQRDPHHFSQAIMDNEEGSMQPPDINKDPEGWTKAVQYAAWLEAANYAKACEDWEKAVVYAKALEDEAAAQNPPAPPAPPAPGIAPHAAPPAPTPAPVAQFRVNAQQTSEFARIQAHIDTLEQFRSETVNMGRRSFIEKLAEDGKIAAAQVDHLSAHALSLNDDQFAGFRASYENAPKLSLFGNQGHQDTTPGAPGTKDVPTAEDQLDIAEEIVLQHRRTGMSEDKVVKTESYRKLVAAGRAPAPQN